jgi:hypothetical protein
MRDKRGGKEFQENNNGNAQEEKTCNNNSAEFSFYYQNTTQWKTPTLWKNENPQARLWMNCGHAPLTMPIVAIGAGIPSIGEAITTVPAVQLGTSR